MHIAANLSTALETVLIAAELKMVRQEHATQRVPKAAATLPSDTTRHRKRKHDVTHRFPRTHGGLAAATRNLE